MEFVDLGLPSGLQWATCNVGAKSPEESGLYFAWGENQGYTVSKGDEKNEYTWNAIIDPSGKTFATDFSDYKWYDIETSAFTKYTLSTSTILESEDDCATLACSKMRMPTYADFQELLSSTTNEWTNDYEGTSVAGRIFTSNINGNSIFVPAAGYIGDGLLNGVGAYGGLWSSSLDSYSGENAFGLLLNSGYCHVCADIRCLGLPVRGVL